LILGRHHQGVMGRTAYQQAAYDWEEIGGDFTLPSGTLYYLSLTLLR
jgi:hypothetical protein